jgi:hypothetical protein
MHMTFSKRLTFHEKEPNEAEVEQEQVQQVQEQAEQVQDLELTPMSTLKKM